MSIEARLIKAGAAVAVLVLIVMLVLSFWGNFRAAMNPAQGAEASATAEATGTAQTDSEGSTEGTPSQSEQSAHAGGKVIVLIDGLNFRTAPERDSELIRGLSEGEELAYIETKDGWYKVKASDGTEGWVSASEQYTRLEQ